MNAPAKSKRIPAEQKKLMQDCFVLLVSLVLSEPKITPRQSKMIGPLIKRLKDYVGED